MRCWRCRSKRMTGAVHHINGNHNDVRSFNEIGLCPDCHDTVQGICDKCANQSKCHIKMFQTCWRFEDALPPINFRARGSTLSNTLLIVAPNPAQDGANPWYFWNHATTNGFKRKRFDLSMVDEWLKNWRKLKCPPSSE